MPECNHFRLGQQSDLTDEQQKVCDLLDATNILIDCAQATNQYLSEYDSLIHAIAYLTMQIDDGSKETVN